MVDTIDTYEDRTKLQVLARMCKNQKGTHKELFEDLMKEGFVRVKVDGEIRLLEEDIVLDKNKKHNIDVVVVSCQKRRISFTFGRFFRDSLKIKLEEKPLLRI